MASLSEKLRRERELRGISLKQISEDTKIGVRFLEALEEDKMELIPGEFYRRSYLRAYARYLGLDEERAVNAYSYAVRREAPPEPASEEESPVSVAPWLKWVAGAVVLVAVPAILLLRSQPGASTETSEPPPTQFTPSPVTPSSEASASGARREGPLVPELSASRSGERGDPLRVDLAVAEPCWLEIHADGELVVTGLKEEGFRQEIGASQEVRLWLGNAGGVSLRINDQRVRPLGLPGEVLKDVSITPENYTDFVVDEARRAGEARR